MALRAALVALLALSFLLPPAAAESADVRVVGIALGWTRGIAGFQWDEEAGVGARYWFNGTAGDNVAFLVTVCATTDSHSIVHCERYPISA